MIHRVIVDVLTHGEHRLCEGSVLGPAEAHALVAGHIHDQASRPERGQILRPQVGQGIVRVLKGAVDYDVTLGQERTKEPAAFGDDLAKERRLVVVIKLGDPY